MLKGQTWCYVPAEAVEEVNLHVVVLPIEPKMMTMMGQDLLIEEHLKQLVLSRILSFVKMM